MKFVYITPNGASIKKHEICRVTLKKIIFYKFDVTIRDQKPETSQWNTMSMWEKKQILKNSAETSFFKETKYDCVSIDRSKFEVTGSVFCKALGQMACESIEKAAELCKTGNPGPDDSNDRFTDSYWLSKENFSDDERAMAQEIINLGYRLLSKKHHPDLSGDQASMQKLNKIREKLWLLV